MPITTKNLELYYLHRPIADLTALKAINTTSIVDGEIIEIKSLGFFRFDKTSSETSDDRDIITPTTGGGRWKRLSLPFLGTDATGTKIASTYLDIVNPFQFKGTINVAADFPTLAAVQPGWFYIIGTNVTDNDPTKTNTGLSFLAGDEIAWSGSTWDAMGAASPLPISRGGTNSITPLANGKLMASVGGAIVESAIATPDQNLRTTDSPTFANVTVTSGGQFGFTQPANSIFYATYFSTINGDYGLGSLTGTPIGGAAVLNGSLDLAHNDVRYVKYDAVGNANSQQTGAFKFKLKPNYSGTPSTFKAFFSVSAADLSATNIILLYHAQTTGALTVSIYDSTGAAIILGSSLGVWSPVAGTTYEFEFNFDITTGATRLFIDGIQKGSTLTGTGTRSSNIHVLSIGQAVNVNTFTSDFTIDDFIIFSAVQHTSNYTPGYSLQNIKVSSSSTNLNTATLFGSTRLNDIALANGRVLIDSAGLLSSQANTLETISDVAIGSPAVNQVLGWNGSSWVNQNPTSASTGLGVQFYLDDTTIIPTGTDNNNQVNTLNKFPVTTVEVVDSIAVTSGTSPVLGESYFYNTELGITSIPAGEWVFNTYCGVNSVAGGRVSSLSMNIIRVRPEAMTLTITGSGTSRTATAASGTPFAVTEIDTGGTSDSDSYLSTPLGFFRITARTSNTVVTISTPTTYVNESDVAFNVCKRLFQSSTGTITSISPAYTLLTVRNAQSAFTCLATDKLGLMVFGVSNNTTTVSFTHNGSSRYTNFRSTLAVNHNDLSGLQGGNATERYHLAATPYFYAALMNQSVSTNATPLFGQTTIVFADPSTFATSQALLRGTTATGAANTGAGITLGGNDGSTITDWAQYLGLKENSTIGNKQSRAVINTQSSTGVSIPSLYLTNDGTSLPTAFTNTFFANNFKLRYDANYSATLSSGILAGNITLTGPTATGTLALTGDISSAITALKAAGNTWSVAGYNYFNGTVLMAGTVEVDNHGVSFLDTTGAPKGINLLPTYPASGTLNLYFETQGINNARILIDQTGVTQTIAGTWTFTGTTTFGVAGSDYTETFYDSASVVQGYFSAASSATSYWNASNGGKFAFGSNTSNTTLKINGSLSTITSGKSASYNPSALTTDLHIPFTSTSSAYVYTIPTEDIQSGSTTASRWFIVNDQSGAAKTNNISLAAESKSLYGGNKISTNYGICLAYADGTDVYSHTLAQYEQTTHASTFSGPWASPSGSKTCTLIRHGNIVSMYIPSVIAAYNSDSTITMTTVLPSGYRPAAATYKAIKTQNNSVNTAGFVTVGTDGSITIYNNAQDDGFSTGGNCGFYNIDISWVI